jgi:hypothetical protein
VGKPRRASFAERSETLKLLVEKGRVVGVQFVRQSPGKEFTDEFPTQLDPDGHLIGITTFMLKDSQNLNFAIAAEEYAK